MLGRLPRLLPFLLALALAQPALAYVRTMASTGAPLFWSPPSITLLGNPSNASGLSEAEVSTLLGGSFSSWNVAGGRATLGYAQSTGHPAASAIDGVNSVHFASRAGRPMDWGVIALTEVFYYVASGRIAEADMVFNDQQFLFTANEGDTGRTIGGRTAVYLPDVAAHEAGHVLGLDHSLVNTSSLIYTAFSGQFSLSPDDQNAARTLYPGASAAGSLAGSVQGTRGGIFGAHVVAVNLASGKVEAGALAAENGSFRLGDIPAGQYALLMEPFGTDPSSVASYFRNVNHRFCGSSRFRRRFYSACDSAGLASVLDVSAGAQSPVGTLAPSCSSMGNPGGPPNSIAAARELPASGGAAFGTLRPGDTHYYVARGVSGSLTARSIAYSLYSPVDTRVEILQADGSALAGATSIDDVASPMPGGKTNFDSLASATVPAGTYLIRVSSAASRVPASQYSAGYDLLDYDGHYLLAFGVDGGFGPSSAPGMSECVSVRNTVQSASFSPAKEREDEGDRNSGCGTLGRGEGGGPFSGGIGQVLLVAALLQVLALARRRGLVRPRP